MNEVIQRLKDRGITLTPQRMAIIEYLMKSKNHPTADEIFNVIKRKYPTMSKATVYSTLTLLVKLGEIRELSISKKGELHFDPNPHFHHHLLCRNCGKIIDIKIECPLQTCPLIKTAEKQGCIVEEIQAYLYGLCPECAKKSNTRRRNEQESIL